MDDVLAIAVDEELVELVADGDVICELPDGAAAFASDDEPPQEASMAMAAGTTTSVEARGG